MNQARWPLALLTVFVGLTLTGCPGPEGPVTYPVSGEVLLDGEPLSEGTIIFEPLTPDGTVPGSSQIENGKFAFRIEAGEKRVRITAEREVGPVDPVMGAPRRENYLPERYNLESDLTATVEPTEQGNTFQFELDLK